MHKSYGTDWKENANYHLKGKCYISVHSIAKELIFTLSSQKTVHCYAPNKIPRLRLLGHATAAGQLMIPLVAYPNTNSPTLRSVVTDLGIEGQRCIRGWPVEGDTLTLAAIICAARLSRMWAAHEQVLFCPLGCQHFSNEKRSYRRVLRRLKVHAEDITHRNMRLRSLWISLTQGQAQLCRIRRPR
jgi:hypothetical protein